MTSNAFNGNFSSLEKIYEFVTKEAKEAGLNDDSIYAIHLAVDETCSNIVEHAYRGEKDGKIICEFNIFDDGLVIVLKGNSIPFEPDLIPEP
jgi:serine/threonine-protein kinase RsbW